MEDFFNSLYKAFSGENNNNSMGEETTTVPNSRTSSVSEDSGFASRSMSFDNLENSSRRDSGAVVSSPPPPSSIRPPPPRRNPNDEWSGAEIAAGIAGVAIAGYAISKLFSSSEPKAGSSGAGRGGYEEEEEVAWGRHRQKKKEIDIFDPKYIEAVSREIRK